MKRKVCVITGTRAEYGLLYLLMEQIVLSSQLELQLVVTGMHLSPEFGLTFQKIQEDNFKIDEKVEMLLSSDTPAAISKSIGLGVISFTDTFSRLKPDIIVILGDRFEIFAAAQAAMVARIPIAHIHGGELTEGAFDDAIRHSITKMAHLHFTASEEYRQRVIQLGEQPHTVYNVGALGIERIRNIKCLSREELSNQIKMHLKKFFLVTLHPTTLQHATSEMQVNMLLKALDEFPQYEVIFTKTNADTNGRIINQHLEKYVKEHEGRASVYDSLGQLKYLSAMKYCDLVIGNSSSGLIEAPYFRKPTINIGVRQQGRLKAESIVNCSFEIDQIKQAINKALSPEFQERINRMAMVYGVGNSSKEIVNVLQSVNLDHIHMKNFYDIKMSM